MMMGWFGLVWMGLIGYLVGWLVFQQEKVADIYDWVQIDVPSHSDFSRNILLFHNTMEIRIPSALFYWWLDNTDVIILNYSYCIRLD